MKNIDKIKKLEHELGRYRKKVDDQKNELDKIREELKNSIEGVKELNTVVDALMAKIAIQYGKKVLDEENENEEIGYRLKIPAFSVKEMLEQYSVRANLDNKSREYTIGVVKEEKV